MKLKFASVFKYNLAYIVSLNNTLIWYFLDDEKQNI